MCIGETVKAANFIGRYHRFNTGFISGNKNFEAGDSWNYEDFKQDQINLDL